MLMGRSCQPEPEIDLAFDVRKIAIEPIQADALIDRNCLGPMAVSEPAIDWVGPAALSRYDGFELRLRTRRWSARLLTPQSMPSTTP
jgi:hypothetical protein